MKVPFKIAADNVTRDDDTPIHKSVREVIANALGDEAETEENEDTNEKTGS